MEYDSEAVLGSRRVFVQNDGLESRGVTAGLPDISPTRGFIRGNKIVTIDSRVNNRKRGKKGQKDFDDLLKSFNEEKAKNSELENQNMRLRTLILESQNEFNLLKDQYDELNTRYSVLEHLEKWGDIIRQKDSQIKKQQEQIQKILTDRVEALNEKQTTENTLHTLRSKIRKKNREIVAIKAAEQINKKAVLLTETETLRNERDIALGKIAQRDVVIEQLKLELKHAKEEIIQKSMNLQDSVRRQSIREKQSQVVTRFKMTALHAQSANNDSKHL